MPDLATSKAPAKAKRPKYGGRQKGGQNKVTTTLKLAIMATFDKVGGEKYLEQVAKDDPKTFCALLAKILPAEIRAEIDGDLSLRTTVRVIDLSGAREVLKDVN
jgi:hypothetical protein